MRKKNDKRKERSRALGERRWIYSWVVVSKIFYFHHYLGKIPILTNIFQRG